MEQTFSIQELINKKINVGREKKEITSWYSSGLGSCMRGRYLERLGNEPDKVFDDRILRIFSVGKLFEDWIVDLVKSIEGIQVETQGRVEDKKLGVSGYWDMKVTKDGKSLLYEIKSKHSKAFWYMDKQNEGANEQHKLQLWPYLWLTGIEEGRILYASKDDLAILEYPVYRNDEKLRKAVFDELALLNKAWQEKNLEILPLPDSTAWQAKYCRWHKQCVKSNENN